MLILQFPAGRSPASPTSAEGSWSSEVRRGCLGLGFGVQGLGLEFRVFKFGGVGFQRLGLWIQGLGFRAQKDFTANYLNSPKSSFEPALSGVRSAVFFSVLQTPFWFGSLHRQEPGAGTSNWVFGYIALYPQAQFNQIIRNVGLR